MAMYSNSMSSAWKRRNAQENRQALESLNIVPRPASGQGQSKPAHHSAPFACDREPSNDQTMRCEGLARTSSRPSTAMSAASTATGHSSQRCSSRRESPGSTAGVRSDHQVLKKMADLEGKVAHERQARREMEFEVENLRSQLQQGKPTSKHTSKSRA
eukprot:TRINITY_DN22921_c0_g1_i1.p1 TRINITY_DN22921_c0_g1~~TRINITY_DN22921_c0_g1_i1.p1  ORF type:complete len:158 (-),score=18.42 TRINITY_DN22921_c0_g1_i1:200-673(-)